MKKKVINLLIMSNNSDGNSNNKAKSYKFISFLLFLKKIILSDLGDRNDIEDER